MGHFVEGEVAIVELFDESVERLLSGAKRGGRSVGSSSDEYALCVKTFEAAVDRLGQIAEKLDGLTQSTTSAIATIEAHGDRIDRLQADNRAMLDDLLNGS